MTSCYHYEMPNEGAYQKSVILWVEIPISNGFRLNRHFSWLGMGKQFTSVSGLGPISDLWKLKVAHIVYRNMHNSSKSNGFLEEWSFWKLIKFSISINPFLGVNYLPTKSVCAVCVFCTFKAKKWNKLIMVIIIFKKFLTFFMGIVHFFVLFLLFFEKLTDFLWCMQKTMSKFWNVPKKGNFQIFPIKMRGW